MSIVATPLADGAGWRIDDIRCSAGPRERPFAEQHGSPCIAAVIDGSFRYRTRHGASVMAPGTLLLGNRGQDFECSHEHHCGDRCLSFHFSEEFVEAVVAAVKGVRSIDFRAARLPPSHGWLPLFARLNAVCAQPDGHLLEELAVDFVATAHAALAAGTALESATRARDERRITAALRAMQEPQAEAASLTELARRAAMSPFHFLRVFRQVVGMSPHQYWLRTRLEAAAVALHIGEATVSTIALDAGFADLSSFERLFKRHLGVSPRAYRRAARRV